MELEIILDKSDGIYSFGEKVTGAVKVIVEDDGQWETLELAFGVKGTSEVHKTGERRFLSTVHDEKERKILHKGNWNPGSHSYPFEIHVPFGPFAYKGQIIRLNWYLQAEARPSGGRSIQSELKLLAIVPGKEFPADDKSKALRKAVFEESPKGSKGCLLVSILLFLAGAIGVWTTFRDQGKDISGIASMVAIVGIALILVNVYQFLVAKRIQMAQTWIESKTVSPGNRVPCGLVFQVNRPVEVQCASATVIGKEVVVRKSGYTRSGQNISHTLCEKKHELKLPVKNVPARVPIRVQGEVSVPEDAPFSFDLVKEFGGGIKLSWNVEFRIEMKNWPDWFYRQEITVLPGNSI